MADKKTNEAAPQTNDKINSDEILQIDDFIRHIAAGTEYYAGHARKITQIFTAAVKEHNPNTEIKDEAKLRRIAAELGVQTNDRLKNEIAAELSELILNEIGKQQGELLFLKRASSKRQEIWRKLGVMPTGIYHEIAATRFDENNPNAGNPLMQSMRCSLANGWGGNMIAAELQDITSGTPFPVLQKAGDTEMVTGFSPESIIYSLGGSFRGSLHPLIDNIVNGRIRGIAGIYNCHDTLTNGDTQVALVKELIKNDILVLFTGDDAAELAQAGLMVYEGAQYAGEGLHSVCEAVGLPPV